MNEIPQTTQWAFIDEAGDPHLGLHKKSVSSFYVVCAVLVDENAKDAIAAKVDQVRSKFCGKGELKSSNIGGNLARRKDVLNALVATGIKFCAFVVDKNDIDATSGLQYKKTFIKYLHGRLYKRLYRAFASLHVVADEHGSPDFMDGFRKYMEERYQKELFDHADCRFADSATEPLVQAADIIAGSLLRVYSGSDPDDVLALLSGSAIIIERWPPNIKRPDVLGEIEDKERYDHLVAQQGIMLARDFFATNAGSDDPRIEVQVETLRYLLFRYEVDPAQYVYTDEIIRHLNKHTPEPITHQTFRAQVVGKLRSQGVIIASSNKGYKIPNTAQNMDSFVSLVSGVVIPYLKRLSMARQQLLLASKGSYDAVDAQKYTELSECLKCVDQSKFVQLPQPNSVITEESPLGEELDE